MQTTLRRLAVLLGSTALASLFLAGSLLVQVPVAQASGAADADARELVRLINGVRSTSGKAALNIDTTLASKARDGAIPCPDDSSKTIAGRARDFAVYGQMSHYLRRCDSPTFKLSSVTFMTMLGRMGYNTSRGEILALNGGYGNVKHAFTYKNFSTTTYYTTAVAMSDWISSSTHLAIVMGSYNRVGCGGWVGGSTYYYACEFSRGGPGRLVAPPATRRPATPKPTASPTPTPSPSATPTDTPTPTPSPSATDSPDPAIEAVAGVTSLAEAESLPADPSPLSGTAAMLIAASAVAAAGAGSGLWVLRHLIHKP